MEPRPANGKRLRADSGGVLSPDVEAAKPVNAVLDGSAIDLRLR